MLNPRFPRLYHGADYNYEQWLEYPEILEADFRGMKEARCTAMTVGIFSWSRLEPTEGRYDFDWMDRLLDRLDREGIKAILATPSGSKPAWMSRAYPEICRVDKTGRREPHGGRHNHCRTSPVYRQACTRMNTELARRYGRHPALLMWHVSNEYNGMPCHCDLCQGAFRSWLAARYGSLDALNRAWWTDFWSHRFGDWQEIVPGDASIQGLMLDWIRFTSDQTLDFFLHETKTLRELTPRVPVTTNFMVPDVWLDYQAFAHHVDMVSWDSYPRWHIDTDELALASRTAFFHDLQRSYKGRSFMLMESTPSATNWQGVSKSKEPRMHLLSSLQAVAHGSDTVQYFQWRQSRGGEEKFHGAVMSHLGTTDTRVFADVARVGQALERLGQDGGLPGSAVDAPVALIYDYHNSWALDFTQVTRNEEKNYQQQCIAHHGALWRRNVAVDVCDSVNCDFGRYRLVVAPMLYMFRPGVARRLEDFVAGGGTLVLTYLSGLVDESDLAILGGCPGGLTTVLGLCLEQSDVIVDSEVQSIQWQGKDYRAVHYADLLRPRGARVEASYQAGAMAGLPAILSHSHGQGRTWYLGTRCGDDFLDDFYAQVSKELGLEGALGLSLPAGLSLRLRRGEDREYAFALNFGRQETELTLPGAGWEILDRETGAHGPREATQAVSGPAGARIGLPGFGTAVLARSLPQSRDDG